MAILPLDGIKVLDLSRAEPGAFCTMLLGDLGADVIMIEAPPSAGKRGAGVRGMLAGGTARKYRRYRAFNRNKRSLALNLKLEKGREVFYLLARTADVIVEGFRPGVVKRLGIHYEAINRMNPGVVYCSITGYGQDGPFSQLPGHDINYVAASGVLDLIGERRGGPVVPQNLVADLGGGSMHAAVGILAAIIARGKTGKGQYLDISFTDSAISLLTGRAADYFERGEAPRRGETTLGGAYPYYNTYETKDGKFIALGCIEPWFWESLCREIGREDFIPYHFEMEHAHRPPQDKKWSEITSFLKQHFLTKTRDEWFEALSKKDIPISPVYALDEVFAGQNVRERDMVAELDDPTEGKVKQAGLAIKLSATPGKIRRLPPLAGEQTDEILAGIGYTTENIEGLRREAVIG